MEKSAIEVKELYKTYGSGDNSFHAIRGISLSIDRGSFISIVGKSGSGKSTILNLMAALDTPTSGEVFIDGVSVSNMSAKDKCRLRNEKIGFIFQSFYIEENYTVFKNIEMPLIIRGMGKQERKKRVYDVAGQVGLEKKLKAKAANLSGGEKQRVAIARAVVNAPSIVFADEPCGNLDTENGEIILNLLLDLVKQGVTVVLVTHNLDDAGKTQRIISLKDGIVVGDERIGFS